MSPVAYTEEELREDEEMKEMEEGEERRAVDGKDRGG